jgi:hypothetical protein
MHTYKHILLLLKVNRKNYPPKKTVGRVVMYILITFRCLVGDNQWTILLAIEMNSATRSNMFLLIWLGSELWPNSKNFSLSSEFQTLENIGGPIVNFNSYEWVRIQTCLDHYCHNFVVVQQRTLKSIRKVAIAYVWALKQRKVLLEFLKILYNICSVPIISCAVRLLLRFLAHQQICQVSLSNIKNHRPSKVRRVDFCE